MDRYVLQIGIVFLLSLGTCWGGPLPSIAVGTCKPNLQSYSTIQDDGTGIYADTDSTTPTLTLTVASNLVTGEVGTATGMALGNIKGTVKSNIVERMFYGIEVFHATMTVTSNTVTGDGGSGAPFLIYRDGSAVMGNKIDAAGATGATFGDAGTSTFKSSTVFNFSLAVSGWGGSFPPPSGYTLSGNTMTDGNNGLRMTNSNTTPPNTYSSVTTPVSSCT